MRMRSPALHAWRGTHGDSKHICRDSISRHSIPRRSIAYRCVLWWYMRPSVTRNQLRHAFADTVRTLRARTGISQEKLALKAGMDRVYLGALEREKHTPTLESIYRLLPILDVTFTQFASEFERMLSSRKSPHA